LVECVKGETLYNYPTRLRHKNGSFHSGHLTHEHRDPEVLAVGLSGKELAPALWQMSTLATSHHGASCRGLMLRAVTADIC
jgi:hypothetical protein